MNNPSKILIFILRKTWPIWERLGFHIVPNHYYYPIPDSRDLKRKKPWNKTYPLEGIELNERDQINLLDKFTPYFGEYEPTPSGFESNGDGPILYSMIRYFKPNKIIEVGSGASTRVANKAAQQNNEEGGTLTKITAIEPYPDSTLKKLAAYNSNIKLLTERAEDVNITEYCQLNSGDFLFIDSSHNLTVGNDVAHLYLKVLPQLPDGVFIHCHDIRYPSEYPKSWLMGARRFWTEQYILQAFLTFNSEFNVIWAGNYMSKQHPEILEEKLSNFTANEGWPGSFWFQRKP